MFSPDKPVGYHAWIDANTVALFVLGPPSTLRIAHVAIGQADTAAKNIGRSLQRIPGRHSASFVHQGKPREFLIKQIDVAPKKSEPVVKTVGGSADRDMAVPLNPHGLLLEAERYWRSAAGARGSEATVAPVSCKRRVRQPAS